METNPTMEAALRHYEAMKAAQKRYYEKNKQVIAEKARAKYVATHPNPRPRGRPPKGGKTEVI